MTDGPYEDPAARVDTLVAAVKPRLDSPAVSRRAVVLVTGPWLAGVSSVVAALAQRLPHRTVVESADFTPADAPMAVVFVISGAAHLAPSDCVLLDAVAEHTDVVVGVVAKIDVHRTWRDVLTASRARLAAHAPRYAQVPWVGVAAAPELGDQRVGELAATVESRLTDSHAPRRNTLRSWESQLQARARRLDRDAEGAQRRERVDALRARRGAAMRRRRQSRSEHSIAARRQIQQARIELFHCARDRCSSVRSELRERSAVLSRRGMAGFTEQVRSRVEDVVVEVNEATDACLAGVAQGLGVPMQLPAIAKLPTVALSAPTLNSRRVESRLMMLLGAGFGLGVALTLSRVVVGLAPGLRTAAPPGLAAAGTVACVAIGLAATVWVVTTRSLLRDRADVDRWAADAVTSLRAVAERLVASRVLAAEAAVGVAVSARDESEDALLADQLAIIDSELRDHAVAAARAAARCDLELPMLRDALSAVRAELGDPGTGNRTLTRTALPDVT
ncbi:hypothetical protein [Mycobacterium spongiae]|uniref:Uncharacterized protein n=1 Tax=Mycobacterium spongiae TaxID=886343 RepID=A0A975JUJ2_9MYCO|nr:hypothetical protein [Mycobacterium spongiae]QUR65962.1 hypothetical protein F6B93_01700 [Mycobacterium spongiae]